MVPTHPQRTAAHLGNVYLAVGYPVSKYRQLEAVRDRTEIARMIRSRFTERYLDPVDRHGPARNGFAIMAISCLMIEAMESFRLGWVKTNRKGKKAFRSFLAHWDGFAVLRDVSDEFYGHVRCGILHQAETTGGWKMRREGPLWDPATRTINAARFISTLRQVLSTYVAELEKEEWDSEV